MLKFIKRICKEFDEILNFLAKQGITINPYTGDTFYYPDKKKRNNIRR